VKQSGVLCCWTFNDYMDSAEYHSVKASDSFAHAAGLSKDPDMKALAARAAQHSSTASQLGRIARTKEL
jgi:hypothetical protein